MADLGRQNSPKSSPHDSRLPAYNRIDSTGTLKTTITLGKKPSIFQGGTFYLMKDPPEPSELTGHTNLMSHYGLEHSYHKFTSKKVKEELSAFLPNLPGYIDAPGSLDNSSLRSLIDRPPITGRELIPLSGTALSSFRLHPGPLSEEYRMMNQPPDKKNINKKQKKEGKESSVLDTQADNSSDVSHEHKKLKKAKRSDEERKKRKKEKKKKKEKEKEEKVFSPVTGL